MINPLINKHLTEDELKSYVLEKDSLLSSDYSTRVDGEKNTIGSGYKKVGYTYLRRFFDGDHWDYVNENGIPERTYNYIRSIVNNYVSFIANEPPEDDVPPEDTTDDIESERASKVEDILRKTKEGNKFPLLFISACLNQSLLGDAFIFGPYIDYIYDGNKKIPTVRFSNVKRPENIRLVWADENYEDLTGFIFHYQVSREQAEKMFAKQMKERKILTLGGEVPQPYPKKTNLRMVTLREYWDDTYKITMINEKVIDFKIHNWGFLPGISIPNLIDPIRPYGVSDVEDVLDPQQEYNETVSDVKMKIKTSSVPHIFYAGESEPTEIRAGQAQMIKLGLNDKVFPDPLSQSTAPFDIYMQGRVNDIHKLSQVSEIFYGTGVNRATARALSVLMQGVNNRVKMKQVIWNTKLKQLNANILSLIERISPKAKRLIQGKYKTDVFFPGVLIRDVTSEINKFNMKLQSQYTTMKNLGIPSPKQEQKLMKKEWDDPSLAIEISRSPQLRMQLHQTLNQVLAKATNPMLTEGEGGAGNTAEGQMPSAAPNVPQQSPTSPEGAIALKGFRGQ